MWRTCSSRLTVVLLLSYGSAFAAAPRAPSECAATLLGHAPSAIRDGVCSSVVSDPRADLGLIGERIYRLDSCAASPPPLAWFYFRDGACRLISGNVPYITGAKFPLELAEQFAVNELNRLFVEMKSESVRPSDVLAHALAVLRMARPFVQQQPIASLSDVPATQSTTKRDRRRLASLRGAVSPPRIADTGTVSFVSFYVWTDPGGVIERVDALVWPDGRIGYTTTRLIDGVGAYTAKTFIPRVP